MLMGLVVRGQGLEPTAPARDTARTILSADCDSYKKIYKQAALKYHPDRLVDAGEQAQAAAKETFLNVQKAYEQICKENGWN